MHDNCDDCGQDYDFDPSKDVLVLYLQEHRCNHVLATCPHCGGTTRIFIIPESFMGVLELKLPLRIAPEPDEDVLSLARELYGDTFDAGEDADVKWRRRDKTEQPRPPDIPRDWIRQLMDDLRTFGSCKTCKRQVCNCPS